jgi:putative hydrolases of HD superfamily
VDDRGDPLGTRRRDPPPGDGVPAKRGLDFVLLIDALKQVVRQNPIATGERRERTAEHSWHVGMAVICFHELAAEQIDLDKAVRLAVIHDLPEVVVGDTFVYSARVNTRRAREQRAIDELVEHLPGPAGRLVRESWEEYEFESTPEGRYVMALDVLLPVFLNHAAGQNSSWFKHNVAAADVRKRVAHVRAALPQLADLAVQVIDDAVGQGLLG